MGNRFGKKKDSAIHNVTSPNNINPIDSSDSHKEDPNDMPPPLKPSSSSTFHSDIRSTNNLKIFVALYTYNAPDHGDLSFCKGDQLGILDDSDPDRWRVCHLTSMTEGFVPCNYVAPENTVESEDWFFGRVSCKNAEKMLMNTSNPRGAFLIRNCKQTTEGANGLCHNLTIPCPKTSPDITQEWEISRSSLQLIRNLHKNCFKDVWYGKWKGTTEVAVNIYKSDIMTPSAILQEASIMKKLRHEKLVSLFAVCSKEPILIVTEYMVNGSLLDYLRSGEGRNLKFHVLIDMAAQISSGMAYLEREQVIHRKLSARNILVGDNNVVKVADFDLARILEGSEYMALQEHMYAVYWTAPEALSLGRFSIKSDVWSYGVLLYELITYGRKPYPGMRISECIEQVQCGYRMPKPIHDACPDSVYSTMLHCWDAEPEKRPTFEFLFGFFNNYFVSTEP